MTARDVPVLIVGGGPVGLSMSICLSRLGIESLLVERHPRTTDHPKATVVNTRTMELFRLWGVEEAVRKGAVPAARMRCIVWATTLAGHEIGRLEVGEDMQRLAAGGTLSPTLQQICAQDIVEPALLDVARSSEIAAAEFATAMERFESTDRGVSAVVRRGEDEQSVTARYLVAADGASSPIRNALGIDLLGERHLGRLLNIHVRCDVRSLIDDRPGPLYWIVNPDAPGVFIALNGTDRWLFNTPMPEDGDHSSARCAELVRRAVGRSDLEIDVVAALPWNAASLVAATYRHGPCFLVGDAAHQFPPTGGHGMNSGIQDAHNLAWKLAAVLRGEAGDALLDTYEEERRPVAQRYADESVRNARGQQGAGRSIPAEVEHESDEGRAIRELIASTIPAQRGHFVSPGLQLGFGYRSRAVIDDGPEATDVDDPPVTSYRPVAAPGRRAPHAWLTSTADGSRCSVLDLVDGCFTLITVDPADPLVALAPPLGVRVLVVDTAGGYLDSDGQFAEAYGLEHGDALLVRPDGFVAWRASAGTDSIPLAHVLRSILASDGPSGSAPQERS